MRLQVTSARPWRRWGTVAIAVPLACAGLILVPASASSVTTVALAGGSGTATFNNVLYAKQGGALTLTVTTSSDTECVELSGAFTAQQTSTPKTSWTFPLTAGSGNGSQTITAAAAPNVNPQGKCTGQSTSRSASFTLDNTAPTVTGSFSPAPNGPGWNNSDVTVTWTATDSGGSGVATQPSPTLVSTNGISNPSTTATDRVGNTGAGSVTVRLDKAAPTITGVASGTQGENGWFISSPVTVTFSCSDNPATGASGIATCLADGTSGSSRTISATGSVDGTAKDFAANTSTASVPVNIDTSAPLLAGAPTTSPNSNGWYDGDVPIHWTASDPQSGIPVSPTDTTIGGEGTGLTSATTVKNAAGLSTTATSAPSVKIDRTAPTTSVTGAPSNTWTKGSVTLTLGTSDNLSGVDATFFSVDGGADTSGTSIPLSTEGDHTVTYWSVDKAGNTETPNTVHIRIDKTAPTIGHGFTPSGYHDNDWTNTPVTVTFTCDDQGGSGVASCTDPVTKSAEGTHTVTGTATDGAGNSAIDTASIRIDLTKPEISASASGTKSEFGWYADDVVVTYTCSDALSGIASCPAPDTLGEGANQAPSGTATDVAGNSASDGVSGIDVDKSAPVLTADYSMAWQTGDVTVTWSCHDALSGLVGPDHSIVGPDRVWTTKVTGEGDDLSETETCTDAAGNTATTTADGIRIDRHPPVTTASAPAVPSSGWYTSSVEVTLHATDALSGVDATTYSIDGGAPTAYTGSFDVTGDGKHQVTFYSTDVAGNVEEAPAPLDLWIDTTAPTTTVINPISPASGWFVTSGIPFAFSASDTESGVASTHFTIDGGDPETYGDTFTRDLSDGPHTVTYWSVDNAGNEEDHGSFAINVDTVPPTIEGQQSPAANAFGWNNTPVSVTFSCSDATSGIPSGVVGCAGDTLLPNEGAGQSVAGDAKDVAGNTSHTTYSPVNIDLTPPSLTGAPGDPNGAGWYRDDVTVAWTSTDALSGIDSTTDPADSVVTGEGRHRSATASVKDQAGNETTTTVTDLRIDRTGPTVSGQPTSEPNPSGWFNTSVVVDWTCADPKLADGTDGSGVASCPTSSVISGDGIGQSVISGAPKDIAGNTGSTSTVEGIDIDGTAPVSTADNTCSKVNGWCTGPSADVVLSATDNLSGVKEIHYRVDGGTEQVAPGSSKTVTVPLSGSGSGTVSYWAVDVAGNAETPNQVALKWDNIAPTVTHSLDPAANAQGWNSSDVTVTFSAKDDDQGSGVANVSDPVTVSTQTSGTNVTGTAQDTAGNVGSDTVPVKLDKTKPTITGAITSGTHGDNGWYVGPVTVTFTCSDNRSGVAVCPDPVVLTANGMNLSASGTVYDVAGNQASATVGGIKIDQEKPTIATVNVQGGPTYPLGNVPNSTCSATDSFSGPPTCAVSVSGGTANGVGTFSWTATAKDGAGNTSTMTGTYKVAYQFDGFLQPINDTAHQVGATTSIFKAGSTMPVKLVLKNAAGAVVQPAVAPEWLTPVKGSSMSAPVDESVYSALADSGSAFRSEGGQWGYNWKTPSGGGNYWRIGVKLDDGQTYYVNIGLR
jgi:hypothetical protein